ncbi:histone deacetylase [Kitasatospora sp. NPDC057223]|uniref:histone deacetylase n=1 Tax=Kitasatospora sp. NPDC057223 TaxID=3346055 RepID=UPI00362A7E1E
MQTPRRPVPGLPVDGPVDRVWYAAYGSNMRLERLSYYLTGGRPPGALRSCPGCRDGSPPERSLPVLLPGRLYFAGRSAVWTGGAACYDPLDEGELPARAHLLSAGQFSDIAAQERGRAPGAELDLAQVLATGRARLGDGRYGTLLCPGLLDGLPVLTFTAPGRSTAADLNSPAAAYLGQLAAGLREAYGWGPARIAGYLSSRPGAAGRWTEAAVVNLLTGGGPGRARPDSRSRCHNRSAGPPLADT